MPGWTVNARYHWTGVPLLNTNPGGWTNVRFRFLRCGGTRFVSAAEAKPQARSPIVDDKDLKGGLPLAKRLRVPLIYVWTAHP